MGQILGRVTTVAGSQITVNPEADLGDEGLFRTGAMVKVSSDDREVIATISAVQCESNSPFKRIVVANLLGEFVASDESYLVGSELSCAPASGDAESLDNDKPGAR